MADSYRPSGRESRRDDRSLRDSYRPSGRESRRDERRSRSRDEQKRRREQRSPRRTSPRRDERRGQEDQSRSYRNGRDDRNDRHRSRSPATNEDVRDTHRPNRTRGSRGSATVPGKRIRDGLKNGTLRPENDHQRRWADNHGLTFPADPPLPAIKREAPFAMLHGEVKGQQVFSPMSKMSVAAGPLASPVDVVDSQPTEQEFAKANPALSTSVSSPKKPVLMICLNLGEIAVEPVSTKPEE